MAKHKKSIPGFNDSKLLAIKLGDLRYDSLSVSLKELSEKLKDDLNADAKRKRLMLSNDFKIII